MKISKLFLFPLMLPVLFAGLLVLLLVSSLYTYHRLSEEVPVAELSFSRNGSQEYVATVAWGDFCNPQKYILRGDQWRLDARFLKWRPWANLLGLDAMYRIERLGGRYKDISEENAASQLAYNLQSVEALDLGAILASYKTAISPVDSLYGSSVYDDMNENILYRVYRGQSGLLVRKTPLFDAHAAGAGLTIEIKRACADRVVWQETGIGIPADS